MTTFTLENLTQAQYNIADELWSCDTQAEVEEAVKKVALNMLKSIRL